MSKKKAKMYRLSNRQVRCSYETYEDGKGAAVVLILGIILFLCTIIIIEEGSSSGSTVKSTKSTIVYSNDSLSGRSYGKAVTIDGCEYIQHIRRAGALSRGKIVGMTHKGNCKNHIHRRKR